MSTPAVERQRGHHERGAGLVSTLAGVLGFVAFLLLAVQLLFNLYATSAVTAAGLDAARLVASEQVDSGDPTVRPGATARAEAKARAVLGRYGRRVEFGWRIDADVVQLRLRVTNPRVFFGRMSSAVGFDSIDRTIRVRVERYR